MGIQTISDYVKFYVDLNMHDSVSLSSFIYNEKLVLKNKLEIKSKREQSLQALKILDELLNEIRAVGERAVMEKYVK